jgi:hypothetical protein
MPQNGPAVKFSRSYLTQYRAVSVNFSSASWRITVQGGYGAVFAVQLQSWLIITRVAYKFGRSRELISGYKVLGGHWRSVAVQTISEPEIYQGAGF